MRILTLSCEYPPIGGGGATACAILAEALVGKGHEVDIVTAGMDDLPRCEHRAGVRILRARGRRRWRHYSSALEQASFVLPMGWLAARLLRERRYDVIHCHFVVPTGLIAYVLARRSGVPYMLTAHGSDIPGYNPERFQLLHRLIHPAWSRILQGAAAVTVPSDFLAQLIRKRSQVPVLGIPYPFSGREPVRVPRRRRVLVAARLVERKGVQHVLSALAGHDLDWEVVIAGDGPSRPWLEQLAAEHQVRASFVGFLPRNELAAIYASSAIFVLPSRRENMPMVLLEAMAAGCAVVTTSNTGCAEAVGDAGLLVDPGDVEGLRRSLFRLMADEELRSLYAARGRRRMGDFAAPRVASRFVDLFGSIVAPRYGGQAPCDGIPV